MAEPHVISALVRKRAELAGDIENAHEALRKMVLDLENLDATLVLFDPGYKASPRPGRSEATAQADRSPSTWRERRRHLEAGKVVSGQDEGSTA